MGDEHEDMDFPQSRTAHKTLFCVWKSHPLGGQFPESACSPSPAKEPVPFDHIVCFASQAIYKNAQYNKAKKSIYRFLIHVPSASNHFAAQDAKELLFSGLDKEIKRVGSMLPYMKESDREDWEYYVNTLRRIKGMNLLEEEGLENLLEFIK